MIGLLLGAIVLFALLGGLRAFERASVKSIKALFLWIAALGGLSLALLLILTGRGGIALGALTLFGPLAVPAMASCPRPQDRRWREQAKRAARRNVPPGSLRSPRDYALAPPTAKSGKRIFA